MQLGLVRSTLTHTFESLIRTSRESKNKNFINTEYYEKVRDVGSTDEGLEHVSPDS